MISTPVVCICSKEVRIILHAELCLFKHDCKNSHAWLIDASTMIPSAPKIDAKRKAINSLEIISVVLAIKTRQMKNIATSFIDLLQDVFCVFN